MRFFGRGVSLMAGLSLALSVPTAAFAQSTGKTAASGWNDGYGRTDNAAAIANAQAVEQYQARHGGYGPSTSNTTVQGDVVNNTVNNGPVNSSTAYNSVNSSQTTSTASGSNIAIEIHTGQTSGTTTQDADAISHVGVANTSTTCGGNNSCVK